MEILPANSILLDVSAKNRSPVKWLAVSPESEGNLLIAHANGLITLWGLKQKKALRHYEGSTQPLESCSWHPEGKFFITGYEVQMIGQLALTSVRRVTLCSHCPSYKRMASCAYGNLKGRNHWSVSMVGSHKVSCAHDSHPFLQCPAPSQRGIL